MRLTLAERHARIDQATVEILDSMMLAGWFLMHSRERIRTRPSAWDINCGWCETWALRARDLVGGEVLWLDELNPIYGPDEENIPHCVLCVDGWFYDSQNRRGVRRIEELHLVQGVSREAWIEQEPIGKL